MDDLEFVDEILDDDNVAIERDSLDYLDDILELNDEELEPDDTEVLDDEFIESHLIPVNTTTIQNFPFVEDDIDAITDYELFSKGFGYLDDKKADKEELSEYVRKDEIPPLDDFVTKDTKDLEYYTLSSDLSDVAISGDYDDLSNKPVIPDVSNYVTKDTTELENYTLTSNLSRVATTGDYDDLTNKPTIPVVPTNISAFTNDSGYITKDVNDLDNYTLTNNLSSVATSGSYNDLSNKPTIPTVPTNVSAFTNDAGYITKNVNDLTNYTLSSSLSTVATSGNYNDLSNKPSYTSYNTSQIDSMLADGWEHNGDNFAFILPNGIKMLQLSIRRGTSTSIGTLPTELRPSGTLLLPCMDVSNNNVGYVLITSAGVITVTSNMVGSGTICFNAIYK